jgi:hypothetical protein
MSRPQSRVFKLRLSALALAVLAAGCVPVPVPVATERVPPRFAPEQIETIGKDTLDRDAVGAKLGAPDMRAAGDRVWVYHWTTTSGAWYGFFSLGLVLSGFEYLGPISSDTAVVVITFDEDGRLLTKEVAREVKGKEDRYCTETALCVELYKVATDHRGATAHYAVVYRLSAVTVKGKARDLAARRQPRADDCLVVMWPDSPSAMPSDVSGGLLVNVAKGQYYSWLPEEAFVEMDLRPGTHTVEAWAESGQGSSMFECGAGESLYLTVGVAASARNQASLVLRRIDPATALALTEPMARALPIVPTEMAPVPSIPARRDLRGKPY